MLLKSRKCVCVAPVAACVACFCVPVCLQCVGCESGMTASLCYWPLLVAFDCPANALLIIQAHVFTRS